MSRFRQQTPRTIHRVRSMSQPQSMELQMDVGVDEGVTLPIVMSTGSTTIIDPNLSYSGTNRMLITPAIDVDSVVAPNTLTLSAPRVVVAGDLHLDDGYHKLLVPYPTEANTILHFDGFELRWIPFRDSMIE